MAASKPNKTQQRLKVSVRRLPPDLPAEVFWRTAAPWVSREGQAEGERQEGAETVAWAEYKAGKVRKSGKDKDSVNSRAYITFKTLPALVAFHRAYDGWSFRDKQGNISQAVVEFAPYSRTPVAPAKEDARQGTIEEDAEFLAFAEMLKAAPAPVQPPTESTNQAPKTTPLLDHLRAQKAAERAARKQTTGVKKGKLPPLLPGATKAQLATAAAGGVQASAATTGGKNGKNGKKEKNGKGKNGKKKPKDASRSGTPVAGEGGAAGGAGGGKPNGKQKPPSRPSSVPVPQVALQSGGIPYPPGSLGAQQQQAQRNAAAQAHLVRQQLQQQHQRQSQQQNPRPAPSAPGIVAPQPQILRNPSRASNALAASPAPPHQAQTPAPLGPGARAGAEIAAQVQRRQASSTLNAVLGEGTAARKARGGGEAAGGGGGRGRGGGGGRGKGGGGRGGGRGGRGGAAGNGGGGGAPALP